ncbi:MAG: hypothetical protein CMP20_07925 [Rickettsiales bacterium]|nr:hypothetical protein [Rickettsiales bacterium]
MNFTISVEIVLDEEGKLRILFTTSILSIKHKIMRFWCLCNPTSGAFVDVQINKKFMLVMTHLTRLFALHV